MEIQGERQEEGETYRDKKKDRGKRRQVRWKEMEARDRERGKNIYGWK